jgi:TolB protein
MLSVFSKKSALLALAALAVSPAVFAKEPTKEIQAGEVVAITDRQNAYNVSVTGDAELAGWASKAINAHGAFDVKPSARLKFNFVKSGANGVTVTVSGSQNFSATATGSDTMQALWAAVDAAIVAAGKQYAVKPMFAATKLAFVRELSSVASEIYAGDLMLPTARAVTGHGKRSQSPQWAPDGRAVYYTSYFRSGGADVFRAELSGGVSPIATYKGTNTGGAVSPDGSRVALALSPKGTLDIYVASASGKGANAIVSSTDVETSPCWSPDGARIAYTGGVSGRPQIMIVPASGGASRKVSTGGYSSEPAWNPVQTNQIAYTQGNCAGIGVADLGGASFSVPVKGARSVSHPAWCADGRHLVVTIGSGKATQLGLLDTQSGKLTIISGAQFGNCSDPATRIAK